MWSTFGQSSVARELLVMNYRTTDYLETLMKTVSILLVFATIAFAQIDKYATITDYKYDIDHEGYSFKYSTSNLVTREETGAFVNGIWTVSGTVTWWDSNGQLHRYTYIADDKGYKQKVILPQPAPIRPRPTRPPPPPIYTRPPPPAPTFTPEPQYGPFTETSLDDKSRDGALGK